MKKTKHFFNIFIVLLTVHSVSSQNISGIVTYKVDVSKDFTMIDKEKLKTIPIAYVDVIKQKLNTLEKSIKSNIKYIEFSLVFNQKEATFKMVSGLNNAGLEETKIFVGARGIYYFNTTNNIKIRQIGAYGQLFLIKSKLNSRKWILTQDTKTIRGYLCYKATSTLVTKNSKGTFYKPIAAWYAPKLSVPYGPKGYGGLPGLILQLTEGDFTFYVSKLTLNPKNGVKIKRPIKGKKVTQEEFEKIGEEASLNFKKMRN